MVESTEQGEGPMAETQLRRRAAHRARRRLRSLSSRVRRALRRIELRDWINVSLTVALALIAYAQLRTFGRQADIMGSQTRLLADQEKDERIFQGPFLNFPDVSIERGARAMNGVKVAGWIFSPIVANDGNVPTGEISYIAGIREFFDATKRVQGMTSGISYGEAIPVSGSAPQDRIQFPDDPEKMVVAGRKIVYLSVGAHGKRSVTTVFLPDDSFIWSTQNGWRTYLYGQASYRDIFDPAARHVAKFCYLLTGEDLGDGFKARVSLCDYWNCYDKDCQNSTTRYAHDEAEQRKKFGPNPPYPEPAAVLDWRYTP